MIKIRRGKKYRTARSIIFNDLKSREIAASILISSTAYDILRT